jgi:hypothetical protein
MESQAQNLRRNIIRPVPHESEHVTQDAFAAP